MSRCLRALPFVSSRRSLTHCERVARTATRPSSQGPASALRFNYHALGHSQWPKPPRFVHAIAPARWRLKSHRPRAIRPLGRYGGARAIRDPPPDVGAHAIVRCGDTPVVLRSLGDRCDERHKRASRAWSARGPASPKGRIESEPRGPSQLRGLRGVARIAPPQLRIAKICRGLKVFVIILPPCFGHFGCWPFPSQDGPAGWTSRRKKTTRNPRLNQRDRATAGRPVLVEAAPTGSQAKCYCRGFAAPLAAGVNSSRPAFVAVKPFSFQQRRSGPHQTRKTRPRFIH